jgi:hypothetical protein
MQTSAWMSSRRSWQATNPLGAARDWRICRQPPALSSQLDDTRVFCDRAARRPGPTSLSVNSPAPGTRAPTRSACRGVRLDSALLGRRWESPRHQALCPCGKSRHLLPYVPVVAARTLGWSAEAGFCSGGPGMGAGPSPAPRLPAYRDRGGAGVRAQPAMGTAGHQHRPGRPAWRRSVRVLQGRAQVVLNWPRSSRCRLPG